MPSSALDASIGNCIQTKKDNIINKTGAMAKDVKTNTLFLTRKIRLYL